MKRLTIVTLILLVLVPLVTVSCNPARMPETDISIGRVVDPSFPPSAPGKLTREKLDELHEKYKDDPIMFDAAVYAEGFGVTVEEGLRRLELQNNAGIGKLETELSSKEQDTFAGLWLEHIPEFKVVVAFTRNGGKTIKKYLEEDSPLAKIIEVRNLEVTLEELQAAQQEASRLLEKLGLSVGSYIDIKKNVVILMVTDNDLFTKTLQEAGEELPENVVVYVIYEPLDEPPPGINPDPTVHFPQLKMASGSYMMAIMTGRLTLEDGYLRVNGTLIIWQPDYFVHNNQGTIEILDRNGVVVGRVGEEIKLGGGEILNIDNKSLREPLPTGTKGPYWIMGGIVHPD